MAEPKPKATYDDVLAAPEHRVAEIVDGELFLSPRPASPHGRASAILYRLLGPFDPTTDGLSPGGWWICVEPEVHLAADVLVPDIAAWRREDMPRIPNVPWFDLRPDWVCETLSPSTVRIDRGRKLAAYARAGIPMCGSSTHSRARRRSCVLETTAGTTSSPCIRGTTRRVPSRSTRSFWR